MQNNEIMWVLSSTVGAEDKLKPFLAPNLGRLSFNIVYTNSSSHQLVETIKSARYIRVGNDARFPKVTIWTNPLSISEKLITEVCKLDNTVPRIKLVVVDFLGHSTKKTEEILLYAKKRFLDTELLFISYGKSLSYGELTQSHKLSNRVYFECFPTRDGGDSFTKCLELVHLLNKLGYDFSSHPLSFCGGISLICRELLLSRFGVVNRQKDFRNSVLLESIAVYNGLFKNISPNCLYGAILSLFDNNFLKNEFVCSCNLDQNISPHMLGAISKDKVIPEKEYLLFEDWQYIYDGFNLV